MILDVSVYDKQAERLFQSRTHLLCARTHKDWCKNLITGPLPKRSQTLKVKTKGLGTPPPRLV